MTLPVISQIEMEAARKVLALGGSLQDAADKIGVERHEMDLLLWKRGAGLYAMAPRKIATPKWGAS